MKREEILSRVAAARDVPEIPVEVPEWGVTLRVVRPAGARQAQFQAAFLAEYTPNADLERLVRMLMPCLLDSEDVQIFEGEEGFQALYARDPKVLERLGDAMGEVCMPTDGKVRRALGESEGGPSEVSSSDSVSPSESATPTIST